MTIVSQMCRLPNTANISHMTTLRLISLRNTEARIVYGSFVIFVSNTDWSSTKFSISHRSQRQFRTERHHRRNPILNFFFYISLESHPCPGTCLAYIGPWTPPPTFYSPTPQPSPSPHWSRRIQSLMSRDGFRKFMNDELSLLVTLIRKNIKKLRNRL